MKNKNEQSTKLCKKKYLFKLRKRKMSDKASFVSKINKKINDQNTMLCRNYRNAGYGCTLVK